MVNINQGWAVICKKEERSAIQKHRDVYFLGGLDSATVFATIDLAKRALSAFVRNPEKNWNNYTKEDFEIKFVLEYRAIQITE